jgi:hypothetical protein
VATSASGKGRYLGIMEWDDNDLVPIVAIPTPASSTVVNDWFWGGYAPVATVIPWTWLMTPLELRMDQPLNSVQITGKSSVVASSTNTGSQSTYGTFSATATLTTFSPDDAASFAQFLTTFYGNPLLRAPTFTFPLHPRLPEEKWRILGREIGDRFTLGRGLLQPSNIPIAVPAGLPSGARSLVIEGIQHSSSAMDGRVVTWTTSALVGNTAGAPGPWFYLDRSFTDQTDMMPF